MIKNMIFVGALTMLLFAHPTIHWAGAADTGPTDLNTMNETDLLAEVQKLAEEKFELTQFATQKATTAKVKQSAQRSLRVAQEADAKLNDLAGAGVASNVDKKISTTLHGISAVERFTGAAFDSGYIQAMLALSNMLVPRFEQLATRAKNPRLKDFAREELPVERMQVKNLQTLSAQ